LLLAAALVVPLGSWLATGWASVERQRSQIAADAERAARDERTALATRLAARLMALAEAESRRPYYHYQNLFHDPASADLGASIVPSPLATGPEEPLVWSYFQVDPSGALTIPTFNAEVPERNVASESASARAILAALAPAADGFRAVAASTPANTATTSPEARTLVLGNSSYTQNLEANRLYNELRSGSAPTGADAPGRVVIALQPLRYAVVARPQGAILAAVRLVDTPSGKLTQGFVLSNEAIARWLSLPASAHLVVDDAPSGAPSDGDVNVGLARGTLRIDVDGPNRARTEAAQSSIGAAFASRFALVSGFATVAAAAVLVLFVRTDRLARQRMRFAASAAHELRTPLAGLRLYGEMLAGELGDPARAKTYAARVADEAARLGRVVDNVLGVSQLERGALRVRRARASLSDIVRETVERMRPGAQEHGAALDLEVASGEHILDFDRDAVIQVLENLVDNAEKYSRDAADRTIRIGVRRRGGFVEVAVVDRGPGVPRALGAKLFSPFARGEGRDAPAGLGLGLALVRALARLHGGDVRSEETPGGGATFVLSLPAGADGDR
jgi:signal transduction histidine kinase